MTKRDYNRDIHEAVQVKFASATKLHFARLYEAIETVLFDEASAEDGDRKVELIAETMRKQLELYLIIQCGFREKERAYEPSS